MRKRNLEHIFKHIILFIAILLPLIVASSVLWAPMKEVDSSTLWEHVEDPLGRDYGSLNIETTNSMSLRTTLFEFKLEFIFDSLGLRPFYFYGMDEMPDGSYAPNLESANTITYGAFQLMSFLGMTDWNYQNVFEAMQYQNSGEVLFGEEGVLDFPYLCTVCYAYLICEYLGYIFYVYVFYFLLELLLFVPRLGIQFGEKLVGSKGEVEW